MEFVCFVSSTGETEAFDVAQFVNKTSTTILRELGRPHDCLFISTPSFSRCLKEDDAPLILYPALVIHYRPGKYERPDYFLTILPEGCEDCVCASLAISSANTEDLPPFRVWFSCPKFSPVAFRVLRRHILETMGLAVKNVHFTMDEGEEIPENANAREIVEKMAAGKVTMYVELPEESVKKLEDRKQILQTFVDEEEKFLGTLAPLMEKWIPEMDRLKFLTPVDFSIVFGKIKAIYSERRSLTDKIKATGLCYAGRVAELLIAYAEQIRKSAAFFEGYPYVVEVFTLMHANEKTKWKLRDMEEEFQSPPLDKLFEIPFGRVREYNDFTQAMKGATPPSHPDSVLTTVAASLMEESVEIVQKALRTALRQADLMKLQLLIGSDVTFLEQGRTVIETYEVVITGKNTSKGTLFLFNDLILVVRNFKVILKSGVVQFSHYFQWENDHSIAVVNNRKLYGIAFKDARTKLEFYDLLKSAQKSYVEQSQAAIKIVWDNIEMNDPLPSLARHACVGFDNSFFVFTKDEGVYNLNIDGKLFEKYNDQLKGEAACRIGDKIYVIDSTSIYEFTPSENKVVKVFDKLPPKVGRTAIAFNNMIVLFGGRSPDKGIDNDVTAFDTTTGKLLTYERRGNIPFPRFDHSASVHNDFMYIFGGKTEVGASNGLFRQHLTDGVWEYIQIGGLLPRDGHSSAIVNDFLILIGGGQRLQMVDLRTMQLVSVGEFGNVPKKLQYFGIDVNSQDSSELILIGGIEDGIKTNNLWSVKIQNDSLSTPVRKRRAKGIPVCTSDETVVPKQRSPVVPSVRFFEELKLEEARREASTNQAAVLAAQRREEQWRMEEERKRLEEARAEETQLLRNESERLRNIKEAIARRRKTSESRRQLITRLEAEIEDAKEEIDMHTELARAMREETRCAIASTTKRLERVRLVMEKTSVLRPLEEADILDDPVLEDQVRKRDFPTGNPVIAEMKFRYRFPGESEDDGDDHDVVPNLVPITQPKAAIIGSASAAAVGYFNYLRRGE